MNPTCLTQSSDTLILFHLTNSFADSTLSRTAALPCQVWTCHASLRLLILPLLNRSSRIQRSVTTSRVKFFFLFRWQRWQLLTLDLLLRHREQARDITSPRCHGHYLQI